MKSILTRARDDGTFDEVGMNNRTVHDGSIGSALEAAIKFGNGRVVRVECFTNDGFYKEKPFSQYLIQSEKQ